MLTTAHAEALTERGLDVETAVRLGVESSDNDDGSLVFPFTLDGKVVNRKFRQLPGKKFWQESGGTQCFWNADVITDDTLAGEQLIITEGEFDTVAAVQSGFPRTVSVPGGAPTEQGQKSYEFLNETPVPGDDVIVLATDSDGPGRALMHDLALRLGKARCKWVPYPKGCKDLNDALQKFGEKGVQESINRAQWIKVDGVYRLSELPPAPYRKPHHTPFQYNLRVGDFQVITGIPSHGKTAFVDDLCCNMVQTHGWRPAIASFEQNPNEDHRRALRTWYTRKKEVDMTEGEKDAADAWIDKSFMFIVPDDEDLVDLKWTLEKAETAVIRHGANMLIIDPWNEMDHERPNGMSLTEYTGFAIKEFKRFAKRFNVHVIVVAHPQKPRDRDKDGNLRIPSLYDISDSAHWYNKADVGIIVHRTGDETLIRIAKSRHHTQIGTPKDITAEFKVAENRFLVIGA